MKMRKIIKELMAQLHFRQSDMLAGLESMGTQITQGALANRLTATKSDNLTLKNVNQMLRVLGYKLVVMPQNMPTSGYEVTDGLNIPDDLI